MVYGELYCGELLAADADPMFLVERCVLWQHTSSYSPE